MGSGSFDSFDGGVLWFIIEGAAFELLEWLTVHIN